MEMAVQQRCTTHAHAAKGAGAVLTVGTDWWLAAHRPWYPHSALMNVYVVP